MARDCEDQPEGGACNHGYVNSGVMPDDENGIVMPRGLAIIRAATSAR